MYQEFLTRNRIKLMLPEFDKGTRLIVNITRFNLIKSILNVVNNSYAFSLGVGRQ